MWILRFEAEFQNRNLSEIKHSIETLKVLRSSKEGGTRWQKYQPKLDKAIAELEKNARELVNDSERSVLISRRLTRIGEDLISKFQENSKDVRE